ncbi:MULTISPECIES: multidrug effflux MFS transporter [Novosphingobium]|uniref:multidrug effflux MFS transporter n=1 Tax=Novosphingobium TaxID=165696 RepID=UPI001CD1C84E|nr:multidrug effflux MFS transporter [Novosphingobium percolationis]MCH7629290.1 multidrug effflux MFS transporter [Pseudomonadota bacterium]
MSGKNQQAAPPSTPGAMAYREFVAMMAMMMALQALAIDTMLPSLGQIADDLGVSDPNRRQLVVGTFLLASGIGSLVPGALADRYGRRPVALVALASYIVLSIACALATDFTVLLVLRVIHGFTCAGLTVVPSAIIRDRHGGDRMARMLSTVSMVFMIVPILAPMIGQSVLLFAGWRWIFALLAVLACVMGAWVWFRLEETLHPEFRQAIRPATIATNMGRAATTRSSIGYVLGSSLVLAGMFGYVNSVQQLVGEHFGAGEMMPLCFGITGLALSLANFFNARIVERFGARRVSHTALVAFILTASLQVLLAMQPHETLWQFLPVMAINVCLMGFIGANFSSIALQPFAATAGAASSVQAFLRMAIASLLGMVIGQAYDGSARPLALSLLLGGLASLALVLWSEHGRLFRRVLPPGAARETVIDFH